MALNVYGSTGRTLVGKMMAVLCAATPLLAQQDAIPVDSPTMESASSSPVNLKEAWDAYRGDEYQKCVDLLVDEWQDPVGMLLRALSRGQMAVRSEIDDKDTARAHYEAMQQDITALLQTEDLGSEYGIVRLMDGIVRTKLQALDEAVQAFELYLNPPAGQFQKPQYLDRLRAEFFLGVVLYRQAILPGSSSAREEVVDLCKLDEAQRQMEALLEPGSNKSVEALLPAALENRDLEAYRWKSYAKLYLGLIQVRRANYDKMLLRYPRATRQYQQAMEFMQEARLFDTREGKSAGGFIREFVDSQQPEIERAMKSLPDPPYVEDFALRWHSNFAYDTNVILLGQRTDRPRDIGRKDDFRFTTGTDLAYTLELGKVAPELDRWSVAAMGRSSANWNCNVSSYNEQDYGGSAAVQYELGRPWLGDSGENVHGPLYATVQYDYDYFLLGNKGFLGINRVSPRLLLYTFDQRALTTFEYQYSDRDYFERLRDLRFDRDGNYHVFGLSQSYDLVNMSALYKELGWQPWGLANDPTDPADFDPDDPVDDTTSYERWLRPYLGVQYGWDSTAGQEYDCKRYVLTAGTEVPLPYGVLFTVGGEWEWQDYYHRGSLVDFHRRSREDFIQTYAFGLERRFVLVPGMRTSRRTLAIDRLTMVLRGDVRFTDDDSNVQDRTKEAIFSYDRAIYGLSVALLWN